MRLTVDSNIKGFSLIVLASVIFALLPLIGLPQTWLLYIFLYFIYLALANIWNLLSGYCGLTSLCQPAFIGLGGYSLVIFTWNDLPVAYGMIGGAIAASLFAIIISRAVFRLNGIYFAIGTLVVPEALRVVFLLWRPVGDKIHGKGAGYMIKSLEGLSMHHMYWLALGIGVLSILSIRIILPSKIGMGLAAIRDNDEAAISVGINIFKLKVFAFALGAFITSAAGAVFFMYQGYIAPESSFSVQWTMTMILATVIGGIKTEEGPIVGTMVIVFLHFLLARYGGVSLIIQGLLLILIMSLAPQGIMGYLRGKRVYQSFLKATAGLLS